MPNYPVTEIHFSIPEPRHVVLTVYDIQGRRVRVLLNQLMNAGTHTVRFDGSDLPAGIYFYTIQAGHFTATRRMLLLK
ncbi:MAG: T9SS type A sorting domain-containing protein [Calditrichaeota bacterium]|nr:T9SS type A sorting domain-containing protein [Calditrichota bacterium]